ncbi:flavin reductase-like, FMN-binding protein [Ketogulonicigenium robustum]|uniref:Flavin reductase-like, FMN-binding protein n=1 Tax=Ketogulonicigenium robustum TaxID=92947 RepID=A0A1W6NWG1_9RHOB|nr:flavin reductase family protein [Ketogulonicigenium robustum]ARO13549.1 flavin reductase-like, FMN-binding protein [Ketogulonicigenium robustum]
MFYTPEAGHGLPHNPMTALVAPRPIGWIATRGRNGQDNLAPYSYFNLVAANPAQVMFASTAQKPDRGDTKDTLGNIRETHVFCVNIVPYALIDAMNMSAAPLPREVDEFDRAGLTKASCETIDCARVAQAAASLECRMTQVIPLEGNSNFLVLGRVTGVHIDDACLRDGLFDPALFGQVTRLGYQDYAVIRETFTLARPK